MVVHLLVAGNAWECSVWKWEICVNILIIRIMLENNEIFLYLFLYLFAVTDCRNHRYQSIFYLTPSGVIAKVWLSNIIVLLLVVPPSPKLIKMLVWNLILEYRQGMSFYLIVCIFPNRVCHSYQFRYNILKMNFILSNIQTSIICNEFGSNCIGFVIPDNDFLIKSITSKYKLGLL